MRHAGCALHVCAMLPAGLKVEYRRQAPGGQCVVNTGVVRADGNIACNCASCQGRVAVPNSTFEEHSGSKVRRPAQFTYLSEYNMSLKVRNRLGC